MAVGLKDNWQPKQINQRIKVNYSKGHMSLGSKMLYHQQNCNLLGARIAPMDNPSQSLARKGVLLSWSYSSIW